MPIVRVPIAGTVGKAVRINPSATEGSQIGVDFRLPDGSVPTLAELADALYAASPISITQIVTETSSGSLGFPVFEEDIVDGTILARVADDETITGKWTFDNDVCFTTGSGIFWLDGDDVPVELLVLEDNVEPDPFLGSVVFLLTAGNESEGNGTVTPDIGTVSMTAFTQGTGVAEVYSGGPFGGQGLLVEDFGSSLHDGNWIADANDTSLDFGSDDFTIEFHYKAIETSSAHHPVVAKWKTGGNLSWIVDISSGTEGAYSMRFNYSHNGSSTLFGTIRPWGFGELDTWYHVAVVRDGNDLRTFVDGVEVGSAEDFTGNPTIFSATTALNILGHSDTTPPANTFRSAVSDVRITAGVARYTGSFSPPTALFEGSVGAALGFFVGDPGYPTQIDGSTIELTGPTTFSDSAHFPDDIPLFFGDDDDVEVNFDGTDFNLTFTNTDQVVFSGAAQVFIEGFGSAAAPLLAIGDDDNGFWYEDDAGNSILHLTLDGVERFSFGGNTIAGTTQGGAIQAIAPSSTQPTLYPNFNVDFNTGIGWPTDDALSLIAGGVEGVRVAEVAGVITNTTFGDFEAANVNGPRLRNAAANLSTPTVLVDKANTNTGFGGDPSDDILAIIVGDTLAIYIEEAGALSTVVIGDESQLQFNGGGGDTLTQFVLGGIHEYNYSGVSQWQIGGLGSLMWLQDGAAFRVSDVSNASWLDAFSDGDDFYFSFTNTETVHFQGASDYVFESSVFLEEQAAPSADRAGYGQFWVRNDTPNTAWFTRDTGVREHLGDVLFTVSTAVNHVMNSDTEIVLATAGGITITLPTAASVANKVRHVKKTGAGTVTIDGNGAETIDGSATTTLVVPNSSVTLFSTGTAWVVI